MRPWSTRNLYLALISVGIFPFFINGYINSIIFRIPLAYWLFELSYWVLLPILVVGIAIKRGGLRFAEIGLHGTLFGKRNLVLLVLLCIVFGPIEFWVYKHLYIYFRSIFTGQGIFQYQSVLPRSGWTRTLISIYFALSAGIVEEIFFRGWMYKIAEYLPQPRAVFLMVSPVLFALIHWENGLGNVLATYVMGVLIALAFIAMRNLWPLIVGHIYTDYFCFN